MLDMRLQVTLLSPFRQEQRSHYEVESLTRALHKTQVAMRAKGPKLNGATSHTCKPTPDVPIGCDVTVERSTRAAPVSVTSG